MQHPQGHLFVTDSDTNSKAKDLRLLPNNVEWTQDLPGDLDIFARLTRAGHFARAEEFYQNVLKVHEPLFPVVAEYGDMLLEQGAFGKAESFLTHILTTSPFNGSGSGRHYNDDETLVLTLLYDTARIHTTLNSEGAVVTAEKALKGLGQLPPSSGWSTVKTRIIFLSLRILNYSSKEKIVLRKANEVTKVLSGPIEKINLRRLWFDKALGHSNAIAQPWIAAELHRLEVPVDGKALDTQGWIMTYDKFLGSEDPDDFIAGISMLSETCRRAVSGRWRSLLLDSGTTNAAHEEDTPELSGLFMKVHAILGSMYQQHWLRSLPEIDTEIPNPARWSRSYHYLSLMAYDQKLLKMFQNLVRDPHRDLARYTLPSGHAVDQELASMSKHCEEHHDFRLRVDMLSRRIIASPRSAAGSLVGDIAALWQITQNSWDCINLLECVRKCMGSRSEEGDQLYNTIAGHCQSSHFNKHIDQPPLISQPELTNVHSSQDLCGSLTENLFLWRSTIFAKQVSRLDAEDSLSLFENCIRNRASAFITIGALSRTVEASQKTASGPRKHVKRLLFLGHTGAGKSSTINAIAGSALPTSDHTEPCTDKIAVTSSKLGDYDIECIDTPGFGDKRAEMTDVKVLRMVQNYLKEGYQKKRRVHSVFYLIDISAPRLDRARATDMNVFLKLIGGGKDSASVWRNVCFVFTHGIDSGSSGKGITESLRSQATRLEDFAKLLDPQIKEGARKCHIIKDVGEGAEGYNKEVMEIALAMLQSAEGLTLQCQREMNEKGLSEDQTSAHEELVMAVYQGEKELKEAEETIEQEIAAKERQAIDLRKEFEALKPIVKADTMDQSSSNTGQHETSKVTLRDDRHARAAPKRNSWESSDESSDDELDDDSDEDDSIPVQRMNAELRQYQEELDELRQRQAETKQQRAKFLREVKEIEDSTQYLPRVIVYNRSNVNVHLRLYSSPFHVVWCYANNVLPGSFATLSCLMPGRYSLDVCLATGTSSEFSTAGQIGAGVGKVCLGAATMGLGGMAVGAAAATLASEMVLNAGIAVGAAYGASVPNTYARRMFSYFASTKKEEADIDILVKGDLDPKTFKSYELLKTMQSAVNGRDSLRLVKNTAMWIGRTRKVTLCHGPEVLQPENPSSEKLAYIFTTETTPLSIEDREYFEKDTPQTPFAPQFLDHFYL